MDQSLQAVAGRGCGACVSVPVSRHQESHIQSRWDRSCRATVVLSHPFDLTMASTICLYWSQLVDPLNLCNFVVLNEANLN